MQTIITQTIFQLILALQLIGISAQIYIPNVAATGNGKRSQPRYVVNNRNYALFKRPMERPIRIPLVAAHGYGKRSEQGTKHADSDKLLKQWIYETIENEHKIASNPADLEFGSWGLHGDEKDGDDLMNLSPIVDNEERISAGDLDSYRVPKMYEHLSDLDLHDNEDDDDDDRADRVDGLPRFHDQPRYTDKASQFRSNSRMSPVRDVKDRQVLLKILEDKLTDAVFDGE